MSRHSASVMRWWSSACGAFRVSGCPMYRGCVIRLPQRVGIARQPVWRQDDHRRRRARGISARRGARVAGRRQRLRRAESRQTFVCDFDQNLNGLSIASSAPSQAQALAAMAEPAGSHSLYPAASDYHGCGGRSSRSSRRSRLAQRLRAVSSPLGRRRSQFLLWMVDRLFERRRPVGWCREKRSSCGPVLTRPHYCSNTPFLVEIFSPLARFDQKTAFWIWQTAQMMCLVAAVLMLARGNDPPFGAAPTVIILSLLLLSRPFAGTLVGAEVTPMLPTPLCCVLVRLLRGESVRQPRDCAWRWRRW